MRLHSTKLRYLSCVSSLLLLAACGDDPGSDDTADAAPTQADAQEHYDTHQHFVISGATLPTAVDVAEAAGFEFPGTGAKVNKLGATTVALLDFLKGLPVQAELDAGFAAGAALQVIKVSVADEVSKANAALAHVVDVDDPADPSNDFGGQGIFTLPGPEAIDLVAAGAPMQSGLFAGYVTGGRAKLVLPLSIGKTPLVLPVDYPQVRLEMGEGGLVGYVGGAITVADLKANLYPPLAELLTRAISENTPNSGTVKSIFDLNQDDVVTVDELNANSTLDTIMAPDVDLDGDGVAEHLSSGVAVQAVPCTMVE